MRRREPRGFSVIIRAVRPEALPETVYSTEAQLLHPATLLRRMGRDLVGSRELAWRLFVRNVSARYRQTALGYLWAVLPPLAATAVFVALRRSGVFTTGDTGVPYVPFLVAGLVLWQTFVDALYAPLRIVMQSKAMLVKINFPREALILAGVAEVLFNFLVRAALLAAVLAWYRLAPPATALLAPLGVLTLIAIGIAIGVLLVPAAVLLQDVEQGLAIVISLWLFATPVLYPPPTAYPGLAHHDPESGVRRPRHHQVLAAARRAFASEWRPAGWQRQPWCCCSPGGSSTASRCRS